MNPVCSVILPSYRRIQRCVDCITSVVAMFDDKSKMEICLRLQEDDKESQDCIPIFKKLAQSVKVTIGKPVGYHNGNVFFMDAIAMATGDWIWLLDDDTTVQRIGSHQGVDRVLKKTKKNVIVMPRIHRLGGSEYKNDDGCPFMIVPLNCWVQYGQPILTQPVDSSLSQVLRRNGWKTQFIDCAVHHHR